MEADVSQKKRDSTITLSIEIIRDSHRLAVQEFASAKEELKPEWDKLRKILLYCGVLAILSLVASITFALALGKWIMTITSLPLWGSEVIIAIGFASAALILLILVRHQVASLQIVPRNTFKHIKENLQWLTKQI